MLDRLDAALRRFNQLHGATGNERLCQATDLSRWLEEEVTGVVEQLITRPDFRRLARWSLDNLAPGASTEVRRMVEDVDRELVESAERLVDSSNCLPLRQVLLNTPARSGQVTVQSVTIGDRINDLDSPARSCRPSVHSTAVEEQTDDSPFKNAAAFVAGRPWRDLVSAWDYFAPTAELNLVDRESWLGEGTAHVQIAEFTPYVETSLRLPADWVRKLMFKRIEYWYGHLRRLMIRWDGLLGRSEAGMTESRISLRAALGQIDAKIRRLNEACAQNPEVPLREAAVRLVQVFSAYRPTADFSWLGRLEVGPSTQPLWRYFLERREKLDVAEMAAAALREMTGLYRAELDPEDAIAEKVRLVPLVVISGPGRRDVYWNGKLCSDKLKTSRRGFTLLRAMAEKARHGRGVDAMDDIEVSLKDAKADLMRLLPPDLRRHIKVSEGTYSLEIPPAQIFVGCLDQVDRLQVIG